MDSIGFSQQDELEELVRSYDIDFEATPLNTELQDSDHQERPLPPSRNAARERTRVRSLRSAFQCLQRRLPWVPPNTKLSKLDVLILATNYIARLRRTLANYNDCNDNVGGPEQTNSAPSGGEDTRWEESFLHPVKKWPMRSRLYAGIEAAESCYGVLDAGRLGEPPLVRIHR